jgi:hypothetical protein
MTTVSGTHPAAKLIADNMARLNHRGGTRIGLAGFGAENMAPFRLQVAEAILQLLDDNGWDVVERRPGNPDPRNPVAEPNEFVKKAMADAHLRFLERQAQQK